MVIGLGGAVKIPRSLAIFKGARVMSIYLCGPITGLYYKDTVGWRDYFKTLVPGIRVRDPMRGKSFMNDGERLKNFYADALERPKGMICRDYNDVKSSSVVVVNFLGAEIVSIGSCFEIAWAWHLRVPVILVMETLGNVHEHCFITENVGFRVKTLEQAAKIAKSILNRA